MENTLCLVTAISKGATCSISTHTSKKSFQDTINIELAVKIKSCKRSTVYKAFYTSCNIFTSLTYNGEINTAFKFL